MAIFSEVIVLSGEVPVFAETSVNAVVQLESNCSGVVQRLVGVIEPSIREEIALAVSMVLTLEVSLYHSCGTVTPFSPIVAEAPDGAVIESPSAKIVPTKEPIIMVDPEL